MPPFFIFLQTLICLLIYMMSGNVWLLSLPISYQLVWLAWFGIQHNTVIHHAREYNRAGAVAWSVLYILLEGMFIARDVGVLSKGYFFIMLAFYDILIAVSIMILVCNTMRDGGEFWSSNLLELCSVVWLSSQVVRGVVLTSGVPILVSIAIVRYVQDKIKKESLIWLMAIVVESAVSEVFVVHMTMVVLLSIVFLYMYRHTCLLLLLSPIFAVVLLLYYSWARLVLGSSDTFEKVRYDMMETYSTYYGSKFPSLPKRKEFTELRAVNVW